MGYWSNRERLLYHLRGCQGIVGPRGFLAPELKCLSLSSMKGLTSLPSLDALTKLQTLDLSGCSSLTSLPPLDGLIALQELYLNGCSGLTSLPSLDGLTAPTSLRSRRVIASG